MPIPTLLKKLTDQNLWQKEITLNRNEYLTKAGKTDTNIYFVLSGTLKIYVEEELEEQIIRFGYQDNLIAALDSFLTENPTDFYIQALKKTTLLAISKQRFMDFIQSSKENTQTWFLILESFVLQQMERERDLLTTSPVERYNRVLKRSPQLFQEIPSKYIAAYLRMTPETLSRIKKG